MKLLTWKTNTEEQGCCHARCYTTPKNTTKSRCICKGENRGVGIERAIENTRAHYELWIQQKEQEGCIVTYTLAPVCRYIQQPLWKE